MKTQENIQHISKDKKYSQIRKSNTVIGQGINNLTVV